MKIYSQHDGEKMESISSKMRKQTSVFTLSILIKYSAQRFQMIEKRKKWDTKRKGRNQTITVCGRHNSIQKTPQGL